MFTKEDLETLGGFVREEVQKGISDLRGDVEAAAQPKERTPGELASDRVAVVGKPDVDPTAGPLYWVHLANGEVIQSHDSASTHIAGEDGTTQLVIGRYQAGE